MKEHIEAVGKMQDYIAAHLTDPIHLIDLAKASGYSPFHAARLFKEYVGKTPFDYIRLMRLTASAKALQKGDTAVLDVAFDFVFASHEGFTKAFSKAFGINPLRYSKQTPPIPFFLPTKVTSVHSAILEGGNSMSKETTHKAIFVQIVERPNRKLLLLRAKTATEYFAYCEEVGCDVWGILTSVTDALYEPIGLWLPPAMRKEGTSEYVQGVEVPLTFSKPLPEGFDLIDLPAGKVMIFQGEPYDDDHFMDEVGAVMETIERFQPEVYGYAFDDANAPRFQLAPMGYRGYIEGRPVKPLTK
jgi:AraC family transcriptional regulator